MTKPSRVRLTTCPPLPPLKAWFDVDNAKCNSVLELKKAICEGVKLFRDAQLHPNQIGLVIDDWDLLVESSLSVIRDGEIVGIKLFESLKWQRGGPERKRKRESNTQSSSEESSTESSSSSDTSSSSSSSSSADRSFSGDSLPPPHPKPSTTPVVVPTRVQPQTKPNRLQEVARQQVPPGQGKPSTHNRNLRRRQRRKLLNAAQTDDKHDDNENSSANIELPDARVPNGSGNARKTDPVPDSSASAESTVVPHISPPVMMASLKTKNKNKRNRGPSDIPLPKKIVFPQEGGDGDEISASHGGIVDEAPALPHQGDNAKAKTGPSLRPRLITPSERQEKGELPPNLFVTSHYCDENAWWNGAVKEQWKPSHVDDSEANVENDVPDVGIDMDTVERGWDTYEKIKHIEQVQVGAALGWKDLSINPQTCTPEVVLNVGSVIGLSSEGSIRIKRIPVRDVKPLAQRQEEAEGEEEEYPWTSVCSNWRVISFTQ